MRILDILETMYANSEIFCHFTILYTLYAGFLERLTEILQLNVVVQLGSMQKTPGPRENRRDRIRARRFTLLMHSVVACHCSVCGFRLDSFAVRTDQDRRHQAERAETLGYNVALNVTIVVLASPDETARGFEHLRYLIIDQAMLVPDFAFLEIFLVIFFVDVLENILKATVVAF